ncbi:MAG: alpha/beta hydrolase [Rhodoferax sp.]|nr:alpha/beta hydrolase [Rhodoferax sp.]
MALHPFIANQMALSRAAHRPGLSAGSPAQARALVASARGTLGPGPAVDDVTDLAIPARGGPVPARMYVAARDDVHGLLVYVHGGGWVCGALDDFDALARTLAVRSRCAVLLVDYRLAPEHRFPCGLHDVEDALSWAEAARKSGFGRELPLVVAGDSAGANLATVALANLSQQVQTCLQCLFYPVTDCDMARPSYLRYADDLPLTRQDMAWFFTHYADRQDWTDPRIAPLRHPHLAGSAPAWIAVAEFDVLHDEGVLFGEHLARSGVPVEVVEVASLAHGFVRLFNLLPEADAVIAAASARIRLACGVD